MNKRLIVFFLLMIVGQVHAASKDLIHVKADSGLSYNRKTGTTIFFGPVYIHQEEMHIEAAKVIVKETINKTIEEITAFGNNDKRAHLWDKDKGKNEILEAFANVIHYKPAQHLVTLKEKAEISQGKNNFKGNLIYYNMQDQTITAPKTPNSQITIVYQPNN